MASPFNIFRKNQRILMAVLIGLAMFAFILAQSLNAQNAPIILGAILGALGLWLLSNKGGTEGWLIAAVGCIVGAGVGAFAPEILGRDAAVSTNVGDLTGTEVAEINQDQSTANEFLARAYEYVRQNTPQNQQQQIGQPPQFGFGRVVDQASAERNAALTYLFGKKADEMGITLTDKAIQEYILEATRGDFTRSDFEEVRSAMQIGTSRLYEILREQLRAQEAHRLLFPIGAANMGPSSPTPQDLWNDFKKLKMEASVAVATLPVSAFVSQVGEPSNVELTSLFEQYKTTFPQADGTPGFRIPRQFRVAYLEILPSEVGKSVAEPTDEEILAHYEANKAKYEFSQEMPSHGLPGSSGEARQPVQAPRPGAAGGASDAPPSSEEAAETEAAKAAADADAKSESAEETPAEEAPDSDESEPPAAPPGDSGARLAPDGRMYVAFQESGSEASARGPVTAPTPNGAAAPADQSGATNSGEAMDAETSGGATGGEMENGQKKAPAAPALPELPSGGPGERAQGHAPTSSGSDEGPSEETLAMIRQELKSQRVREALDARHIEVREQVDELLDEVMADLPLPPNPEDAEAVAKYEAARRDAIGVFLKRLEEIGKEEPDLDYGFTPSMSYEDLATSEAYTIGQAMRWRADQPAFGAQNEPIADVLFRSQPDSPLVTIAAESVMNQSRYVLLKMSDAEQRIPEFTDPGIQEQVTEAWQTLQARELAEARALELAEKAKSSDGDLDKALKSATITGEDSSDSIVLEQVEPFSWMSRSSVPSRGMSQEVFRTTSLPQVPGAGEEFMQAVFEKTPVGGLATSGSVDRESFYVVKVESRTSEEELAAAREEFMKEDFFQGRMLGQFGMMMNPYLQMAGQQAGQVGQKWLEGFMKEHGVITSSQAF